VDNSAAQESTNMNRPNQPDEEDAYRQSNNPVTRQPAEKQSQSAGDPSKDNDSGNYEEHKDNQATKRHEIEHDRDEYKDQETDEFPPAATGGAKKTSKV